MAVPANFDVTTERDGTRVVVAPEGEIDLATVDLVRSAVDAYWQPGDELVIDLRGVGFMDTSGLRYTLELNERAERDGWRLRLVRGPGPVQRVFDVAGLAPRLPFVDDPSEAPASG